MAKMIGFGDDDCPSETELDTEKLISEKNRKNRKSGGFQSMGLSSAVYRGIIKKGYKIPTPIQRKCIGLVKAGGDVVAMARTGSGKTAAFLIPMYEKLKVHSSQTGARALIFSPTRELAVQTGRFCRELGKFTNLRSALILGGDRIEDQFSAIHDNPDILIATPGRFLHVVVEMDLKLTSIQYVVFDEADRLFEMGLQEQLIEIMKRLPESRQTLLFSATLPKSMVEFARAGLTDPTLVRLDVDNKLNEQLKCAFIGCKSDEKLAVLVHLLQEVVKPEELTVVFAPTRHHVEYLSLVLDRAGVANTCVYSSLDAVARKINVAKFQARKCGILIVTDLAARGIDIPILDNVINYNFPAKAKLFVHRVGRVARAGRLGCAYSIISSEEVPYLIDLHLFLGEPVKQVPMYDKVTDWNKMYGIVPPSILSELEEDLRNWHSESVDLENMAKVTVNAYKQYIQSRPQPSSESVTRSKETLKDVGFHPLFASEDEGNQTKLEFLNAIKGYKPHSTIFEIGRSANSKSSVVMKNQREMNSKAIMAHQFKQKTKVQRLQEDRPLVKGETAGEEDIQSAFTSVVSGTQKSLGYVGKKRKRKEGKDTENYLGYTPSDHHSEKGLGLGNMFAKESEGAVLDFTADEVNDLKKQKAKKRWDRKKKKFVTDSGKEKNAKKIKTESGTWINASYKTNIYEKWMQKQKSGFKDDDDEADKQPKRRYGGPKHKRRSNPDGQAAGTSTGSKKGPRLELKNKDQILKSRRKEEALKKRKEFMAKRRTINKSNRKGAGKKKKR